MDLRIAGLGDSTAIATLHAASWRNSYRGILTDDYLDERVLPERIGVWRERFLAANPAQYAVVAEDEGAIVGFACAYGGVDAQWGTMLDNLHVLPEQKRKGTGTTLISNVASWSSRNYPGKGVFLWVFERNFPARDFYERLDGVITGEMLWTAPEGTTVKELRYVWSNATDLLVSTERAFNAFKLGV